MEVDPGHESQSEYRTGRPSQVRPVAPSTFGEDSLSFRRPATSPIPWRQHGPSTDNLQITLLSQQFRAVGNLVISGLETDQTGVDGAKGGLVVFSAPWQTRDCLVSAKCATLRIHGLLWKDDAKGRRRTSRVHDADRPSMLSSRGTKLDLITVGGRGAQIPAPGGGKKKGEEGSAGSAQGQDNVLTRFRARGSTFLQLQVPN